VVSSKDDDGIDVLREQICDRAEKQLATLATQVRELFYWSWDKDIQM